MGRAAAIDALRADAALRELLQLPTRAGSNERLAFERVFEPMCEAEEHDASLGTSFAYSLFVHSFHARRDRVVLFATVQFVRRGHAKTPTTRAGPWPDFALRLE